MASEAPSEDFISPAASIMSNLASDQGLRGKVSHAAFLFPPVTWLSILCTTPSLSSPGLAGNSFLNPRTLCVLATKAFRNAGTSEVPSLSKQGLKKHHSRIRATAADQTIENCFDAEGEQRPGTADRRPGTADRRPGTAGSMSHSVRSLKSGKSTLDATQTYWKGNLGNYLG